MSTTFKCDNGDLMTDAAGRFLLVNGIEKCAQDIAEGLLNVWDPAGNNNFNGSELALIQSDPTGLDAIIIEERIRYAVQSSVERLMSAQMVDLFIDEDEQIEEIRELYVRRLGLFTYGFYLRCITTSEEDVPMGFSIQLNQQLPSGLDLDELRNELRVSDTDIQTII